MTQKNNIRRLLVAGLVFGSLGGWLLHVRIHNPAASAMNLIPFITGLISIIVIPAMFFVKNTRAYAYVINGMFVIIGTITMARVSLLHLPAVLSIQTIFIGTLLADIFILVTNFMFGKALFELDMLASIDAAVRHGRFWRYPNMGWWWVHLFTLSFAYTMGALLWK
jgi:hypothetical protein